jgi:hypothetical protein
MHIDPIICLDGAATTLLTIQYNLAAGTLGQFASDRADIATVVDDMINFKVMWVGCGHFYAGFYLSFQRAVLLDRS